MATGSCRRSCRLGSHRWPACMHASLAICRRCCGHAVRPRPSHRHELVAGRRSQRRLPRLLLLPGQPGTQGQIGSPSVLLRLVVQAIAVGRAVAVRASTIRRPSATGRRSKGRASITIRRRDRPSKSSSTDTCGSRCRWVCGIRCGAPSACRCWPCCTCGRRTSPRCPGRDD